MNEWSELADKRSRSKLAKLLIHCMTVAFYIHRDVRYVFLFCKKIAALWWQGMETNIHHYLPCINI